METTDHPRLSESTREICPKKPSRMARCGFTRTGLLLIVIAAAVSFTILLAVLLSEKSDRTREKAFATGAKYQFDDLFAGHYYARGYRVSWISDSEYVRSRSGNVTKTDLNTNTTTAAVFIPSSILKNYNVSKWWLSPDRDWALLACNTKRLYRRSFFADYFAYHMGTEEIVQVIPPNPEKQIQLAVWGNNGSSLGFVQGNNIYWKSSVRSAETHVITDTGKENKLFNGVTDWVYEEDVTYSNRAMWFSPSGRFLCFAQSNDTHVSWFPYMWYGPSSSAYTNVRRIAYPKPGYPNPVVKIKLVDLTKLPAANTSEVAMTTDLELPVELKDQEHYYANVAWATNETVLVWWLNRIQNMSIVMSCNSVSCTKNYKHTVTNGWIATQSYLPPSPWFSKDGSYYLTLLPFPQGKEGRFIHLAKVTAPKGREGFVSNLTRGVWEVTGILAFDQDSEVAYISSAETSPRERHIYSVEVKTGKKSCLTCDLPSARSGRCKYFTGTFSDQGTWYVLGCLGPGVPRYTLRSTKTNRVVELEDNSALQEKMDNLLAPKVRNFVVPSGNYELEAQEFLPPDFSEDKKYGVLFDVYGGPASQKVTERFQLGWIAYLVSNFDLIVVRIDARGSSCRGERFRHAVYKMLGEYEAEDVINAGRFMQRKRYVDESKLAIWGWSYGGYLATYVLSEGTGVFKCGIAVAPVTDWRYYDTAYTERYMTLPQTNPEGYANTSLLSRASKFSDVDYLIIHGSGDDNVHYQHTAEMARALTEAEVSFRIQYYTDKAHGLSGAHTRRHLYRLLTKFLTESLGLA